MFWELWLSIDTWYQLAVWELEPGVESLWLWGTWQWRIWGAGQRRGMMSVGTTLPSGGLPRSWLAEGWLAQTGSLQANKLEPNGLDFQLEASLLKASSLDINEEESYWAGC